MANRKYIQIKDLPNIDRGIYFVRRSDKAETPSNIFVAKEIYYNSRENELVYRQIDALKNCVHDNILQFVDIEKNEKTACCKIITKTCDSSLEKMFETGKVGILNKVELKFEEIQLKSLEFNDIHDIFSQCCSAVQYMHSRNIVHRDIKPANIFFNYQQNGFKIKLGDFENARSLEGELSLSVGTIFYMAPEISDKNYGTEVDMYSLGVVLFELCLCCSFDRKIYDQLHKIKRSHHFYDQATQIQHLEASIKKEFQYYIEIYKLLTGNKNERLTAQEVIRLLQNPYFKEEGFNIREEINSYRAEIIGDTDDNTPSPLIKNSSSFIMKTLFERFSITNQPMKCYFCTTDKSLTLVTVNDEVKEILQR